MAPELVINSGQNGHSYQVDIWAIGVIMYTLLVGNTPFEASDKNLKQTLMNITECKYNFPEPKGNKILKNH